MIVILNPFARSGKAATFVKSLRAATGNLKIAPTTDERNATLLAREAVESGSKVVIAAGGDGTMNEVLNGIVGTGAILGVLPLGTVNVLARQLGIPLDIRRAWNVIERGHTQILDLIRVDFNFNEKPQARYAIQLAGVGLDAKIIKQVAWKSKKQWGPLSYVFEALRSIPKKMSSVTVRIDQETPVEGSFLLMGNGSFYGGPIPVFNKASMTDGLLDLCLFQSSNLLNILVYLQAVLRGVQSETKGILYRQFKTLEVTSHSEVPIEVDGEFAGHLPVKVSVVPGALKILVPQDS